MSGSNVFLVLLIGGITVIGIAFLVVAVILFLRYRRREQMSRLIYESQAPEGDYFVTDSENGSTLYGSVTSESSDISTIYSVADGEPMSLDGIRTM